MFTRTLIALAATAVVSTLHAQEFKPNVDPAIAPCADFTSYVNSRWIAANPLPADKVRWGAFDKLAESSLNAQRSLVEKAEQGADHAAAGSIEQKIGWFFHAAMDEAAIERAGIDPIKPELASIAALKDAKDITVWLSHAHKRGSGLLFAFGALADFKNAQQQIGFAFQGGLNLPSPEYYSKDEYKDKRDAYVAHVAKLFELAGVAPEAAQAKATNVLAFETRLAAASLLPVELRVPENQYHKVSIAEANQVTPHFDWAAYFKVLGVDASGGFSLSQPKFFAAVDAMLADTPIEQWRDYLALQTLDNAAPSLTKAFQEENFAFYDKTLKGQPEMAARWKRALGAVNGGMGQALGQLYVKAYFPPEAKARAKVLVDNVRMALKARIEKLEWMTPETKAKALEKWSTFLPKIGYPDTWRDWGGLSVKPGSHYANVAAARAFNTRYNLAKIGKATDRYEWSMTPQTVNAYYSPSTNTINFPAAILQAPFFYAKGDDAVNYGAFGAVIGHESLHGFDDKGSQFDGQGNNKNWWTKEDRDRFEARTQRLIDQANAYAPLANHPDKKANGKLTLGENIADLGGLNVAFDAMNRAEAGKPDSKLDGYTREQRFFMSFATVWAGSIREQAALVRLNTDPHAPNGFRASASPSNMPAFATAFSCKAGDPMVRPDELRVQIW